MGLDWPDLDFFFRLKIQDFVENMRGMSVLGGKKRPCEECPSRTLELGAAGAGIRPGGDSPPRGRLPARSPKSDFFQSCPPDLWGCPRASGGVWGPLGVPPMPSWGPWGPIGPMGGAPLLGPLGPYLSHVGPYGALCGPYVGPMWALSIPPLTCGTADAIS